MQSKLEADDIIYLCKKKLRKLYPECKVVIITSDHDLMQMIDENTFLIDLKNKLINKKSCGDPEKDLKIKIICGDKSDNIVGCFKRCGVKTAMKLIENNDILENKFAKNEGSRERYILNTKLIDMKNIPSDLVEIFETTIDKIEF